MNSVKLYSNGSAVISKGVDLNGPTKVSIPVKSSDLDDVVSSLSVHGDVTLPEPPSYTPANSNTTTLSLDGKSVMRDLATKLRGAEVQIQIAGGPKVVTGKLYGVQTYQQETNGSVFEKYRVLVGTDQGIVPCEEASILSLRFTEPSVQEEIDKSLQASFQQIKPDSRFVDLTIVPNNGAKEAMISYATPVAAWKIRYQLRFLKGVASLEGQAVVDNDTDDDWKSVNLSVIVGEPISFSTDIAEIRRPQRSRVNVVSDRTVGAVSADETIRSRDLKPMRSFAASATTVAGFENGGRLAKMACVAPDYNSYEGGGELECAAMPSVMSLATVEEAEVKESGDFSIFTSPNPVTILSKKSAIIGLFSLPLEDARSVLLYKGEGTRPYRAVKFNNTTQNSLGKGVCEVYVEGDRQGKCVLEATKQGQESLLVHALETGVKVFKQESPVETRQVALRIKDGVIYCENLLTVQTTYKIDNAKAEEFDFDLEYTRKYPGSKLEFKSDATVTAADTSKGQRVSAKLPTNGELTIEVTESLVTKQQYHIGTAWLQNAIIDVKHPLARNKNINKVIELQAKVDQINEAIEVAETELETHESDQERLLKLIPNVALEQAGHYKNDLNESEQAIRTLNKTTLPNLRKELSAAEKEVQSALGSLRASWSESPSQGSADEAEPAK